MREVENLPFGPTARWTSLNLVGSFGKNGVRFCRSYDGKALAQARKTH